MSELFIKALNLSISASLIILVVMLFRVILARKSHRAACILWIVVALRLIIPFTPETDFGIMPTSDFITVQGVQADIEKSADPVLKNEPGAMDNDLNVVKADNTVQQVENRLDPVTDLGNESVSDVENTSVYPDNTAKNEVTQVKTSENASENTSENTSENISETVKIEKADNTDNTGNTGHGLVDVLSVIWLTGIFVMLVYTMISYIRMRKLTAESVPESNYNLCDRINTPFILGVFKPMVFMPTGLSDDQCENVMAHERAHINRLDHVWKPLGFLLLSIYWFNPFMWLAYILLCKDIEFACDETVVSDMTPAGIKSYSETLLVCGINAHPALSCPLAFGEISVKERVKAVLNYKKPAFWIVLTALVLCIVIGVVFMTKSSVDKPGDNPDTGKATDITEAVTGKTDDPATDITDVPTGTDIGVKQEKLDLGDLDLSKELSILDLFDASKILESDLKKIFYMENRSDSVIICCDRYENDYLIQRDAVKWFKLFLTYFPSLKQVEKDEATAYLAEKDRSSLTISSGIQPGCVINMQDNLVMLASIPELDTELAETLYFRYTDKDFVPDYGDIRRIFFQEKQYETYVRECEYTARITEPGVYPSNTGYLIDLDGDGVDEKLYVAYCGLGAWAEPAKSWIENANTSRGYNGSYSGYTSNALIYVNGELKNTYYVGTPEVINCFAVTDIDRTDKKFEILIDQTDNVVDNYRMYVYNKGKLIKYEFTWGFRYRLSVNEEVASYIRTQIPGDGYIYATKRLHILDGQFWDDCVWKLEEDGSISEITDMFYPWETMKKYNCADDEHKLKMEYPVMAHKEMNIDSERVRIEPGLVIPDMTDGYLWLHIVSEDGSAAGWICIDEGLEDYIVDYYNIIRPEGVYKDEDILFSNLAHAN